MERRSPGMGDLKNRSSFAMLRNGSFGPVAHLPPYVLVDISISIESKTIFDRERKTKRSANSGLDLRFADDVHEKPCALVHHALRPRS